MLSEPRSSLPVAAGCCQLGLESDSLNFLIILTAGIAVLFPGHSARVVCYAISDSSARVAALGGRVAEVATYSRQHRS